MDVSNPVDFGSRFGAGIVDAFIIFIVVGLLSLTLYGQFYNEFYRPVDLLVGQRDRPLVP
ncbi:hypothetical protein [Virgibacillus ndiopensis]|uniref:hypothetical protein n=1 Tax=Virgibacillus ndiopensis TaxID=2004408 RepID=UPI000C0875B2|nr:hypothetical protein [Virgibacillus ndiopensis]